MALTRRNLRRPQLSASEPDTLQPASAPMQKMDTQKAQMLSASAPAPFGMPRAARCTAACVFMLPLL